MATQRPPEIVLPAFNTGNPSARRTRQWSVTGGPAKDMAAGQQGVLLPLQALIREESHAENLRSTETFTLSRLDQELAARGR